MSTPEGKVKSRVDAILAKYTNVLINPTTKGYGKSGAADKITCIAGFFVAIETKSNQASGIKKYPTKLQQRFLANVLRNNGYIAVVNEDNIDRFEDWIQNISHPQTIRYREFLFEGCPHPYEAEQAKEVTF